MLWLFAANKVVYNYGYPPEKKLPLASRLSRWLEVIGTDTDRCATYYDLLLVIHNNYGPIWHRFRDKRRFRSKNRKFFSRPAAVMLLSDDGKSLTKSTSV